MSWFELTAAASAFTPHVLLALAAEPSCEHDDIAGTLNAYFPWASLVITMLDSYADRLDDAANGDHSYISHYGDAELAVRRLCEIVARVAHETRELPNGDRHATLVACMLAMYLSRDGAYAPDMRAGTRALAQASGSLTRLLLPLLRVWRAAYLRRAAGAGERMRPVAARSALPPGLSLPRAAQTFAIWKSPHACLERCRRRYGSRFTINMTSHPPLVFLSDRDEIKAMLTAPAEVLHPGEGGATIMPIVGEGSFMLRRRGRASGWSQGRSFRPSTPGWCATTRRWWPTSCGARSLRGRRDIAFALHPRLRALTLEVILRTIFGASGF